MEEIISTGAIDGTSSDLELVNESIGDQIIGLRFAGLNVPQGAVITNAYIQFTTDETASGATTLTFRAQAADSAATFPLTAFCVSSRPLGAAGVTWSNLPAWNTLQEQGTNQRTPNLKALIQEVVDRTGWKANNALAIFITGTGKRVAESYEGATSGSGGHAASQAPTLTVEYVVGTTVSVRVNNGNDDAEENVTNGAIDLTSTDLELTEDGSPVFQQYVGMRFASVNIPKGATIATAHVQFATDETFSDPTNLTIRGQASDNAPTYAATTNNISLRPVTTASVSWSNVPAWTVLQEAGSKQRTPDLAAIMQEIVNRPGWNAGNAMAIRIQGPGRRTAEAFNGSAAEAPLLVVRYYTLVPPVAPVGVFPVPKTAVWKYRDNGADLGTAWRDSLYNDSTWAFGAAQLGYGDGDEATAVSYGPSSSNKYITTYFRHTFVVNDISAFDSLRLQLMRDDGAIVYLNGNEVVRANMPAGAVTSVTPAASTVGGGDESAYFTFLISKQHLVVGKNVLAVELHQDAPTSSDISFALSLEGKKNDVKLITRNANWEYSDAGVYPGDDWYKTSFGGTGWQLGLAPLGYGNGNEGTRLSYGSDPANKHAAAYFRRNFTVADTTGFSSLLLKLRRDDGAIVYLNGAELLRNNMPSGPVDHTTLAVGYVEGGAENEYIPYYINRGLLRPGINLIAVEVHQNSRTSTDLAFDLELTMQEGANALTPLSRGVPPGCNSGTIGCFTSVIPTAQQQTLVIPPTHTFQLLVKSGRDRYTGTGTTLPGGNDFTGFIPRGGTSSVAGVLSINHENTPGGVSMLDMHYDGGSKLWKVDTITPIDFGDVVTTTRNCSGGVTPWGTVITSEETFSTGDANSDGYHDVGWNVEIDPRTKRIRDFDNDGRADKLWMVGRMNHENVCLLKDSVTLYQGEDGGTGCVYKFVAVQKGRMDSGALFVLRRDGANATTGTWVPVPNATKSDRNTVSTVAGALGGARWGGVEDVEVGPDGKIYFTEKGRGETWRFRDNGTTVSEIEAYLTSRNYALNTEAGTVNEAWGTGNDNLAFDNEGNLWVLQDGGRNHLWMVHRDHTPASPKVFLFATTPAAGEPTGITFSPDNRFMFLSIQHPGANTVAQIDAAGDSVVFNQAATLVIARKEDLGAGVMPPVVNLGADTTVCDGEVVRLTYTNPDALGIWNNNNTDSVLTVWQTGRYWITVIGNNGEVVRDSINVWFKPRPQIDLGPNREICEGESYTFSLDPSFNYVWEDGSASRVRTVNRSGVYSVMVTSPEGCTYSDTVVVMVQPVPRPNLGGDRRICLGASTLLTTGAGFNGHVWSTGATTSSITVSTPGTYWVKVMSANGCPAYDTVVVSTSRTATLGENQEFCTGSSATLTPGAGYTAYLWSDGSTGATLRVTAPGEYWVKVTDDGGCESADTVTIAQAPQPAVSLGRDTTICSTCSLTLDAGEGHASYAWSTGATTRTITVNEGGSYSVTVRNTQGCSAYDEIDVATQVVAGAGEMAHTDRFSVGTYPNPFTDEVTVQVNLKARSRLVVEIYDLNGRRVALLKEGVAGAGRHEFRVAGEKLGGNGIYMLKVAADGREISRKLVRQ